MQTSSSTNRRIQTVINHLNQQPQQQIQHQQTMASSNEGHTKISLSTHVLETGRTGKPYDAMRITLYVTENASNPEIQLAEGHTNSNGRITMSDWKWTNNVAPNLETTHLYRLRFHVNETGYDCMYPFVDIHFLMQEKNHYHIPLLLNPFGYSTYRGS
jgi:5-hydroxyisourate hydrolase